MHVQRGADEGTIKRAYRKLALKMHPDKVHGSEEAKKVAADKFAEVSHGERASAAARRRLRSPPVLPPNTQGRFLVLTPALLLQLTRC